MTTHHTLVQMYRKKAEMPYPTSGHNNILIHGRPADAWCPEPNPTVQLMQNNKTEQTKTRQKSSRECIII